MSARLVGGRYQLHALLGRGGMAAVWAAFDTRLDRSVAVKMLDGDGHSDPVMVARLSREARAVAGLAHPNVVAVYDVGTERGVPYLVMELVDGEDLHHRLARGPLEVRHAVGIAAQICAALEAAHQAGVVHRDIKPGNILLTRAGAVKVCDFGIAGLQRATEMHLTGSASVLGTIGYMAPEQATGGPVDARSDLYALGCVLYTMLTGGPPFSGDSPIRVLWQQVHEPPAPVGSHRTDVPAELEAVVMQLLAKNPADRPDTAGQVRARLADLPDLPDGQVGAEDAAVPIAPFPSVHARATVVTHTQTMPALEVPREQSPTRSGLRLGPAGIAAVAAGAAAATALAIALFTAGHTARHAAPPTTSAAATVSTSATNPTVLTNATVNAVRAAIQAQLQAGQLDAHDADDLASPLEDIDRNLARGRTDEVAQKVNDLRDRLTELRNDNKITEAGYSAILTALDQLANTLPTTSNGHEDR